MTINVKAREIDWRNVCERAVATALQAGLALVVVGNMGSLETAVVAAVAAGLAVIKNAVQEWLSAVEKV